MVKDFVKDAIIPIPNFIDKYSQKYFKKPYLRIPCAVISISIGLTDCLCLQPE
jgi:hypothetical protein